MHLCFNMKLSLNWIFKHYYLRVNFQQFTSVLPVLDVLCHALRLEKGVASHKFGNLFTKTGYSSTKHINNILQFTQIDSNVLLF